MNSTGKTIPIWYGIFTFSATIIGAGILALPIAASRSGFLPLAANLIVIGVVSIISALYIAEITFSVDAGSHLPAISKKHLGVLGEWAMLAGMAIYIYGALTGYITAGGVILFALSKGVISIFWGKIIYFVAGLSIIYAGLRIVSVISTYLFLLMIALLGVIIILAAPMVNIDNITVSNWPDVFSLFGITVFAYVGHSVIPSLARALKKREDIKKIAVFGILPPILLYLLWAFVVLGAVSTDALDMAGLNNQPATIPLGYAVGGSIILLGSIFAVFSTLTSYIGFGASLKDAWMDIRLFGHNLTDKIAIFLTCLPPLLISLTNTGNLFVRALDIAGGVGGAIFVGVLPTVIILKIRRKGPVIGLIAPAIILLIYFFGIATVIF